MGSQAERIRRALSLAAALFALSAFFGCAGEPKREQVVRPVARPQHRTFVLESEPGSDPLTGVRDLRTGEVYTLDARGGLMVLTAPAGIIDTLTVEYAGEDAIDLQLEDSSFVWLVRSEARSSRIDVLVVSNAKLHWAAGLHGVVPVSPADSADSGATVELAYNLTPSAITGWETYHRAALVTTDADWRHDFDLRFDDSLHVFYNTSLMLDSVPVASSSRTITGQYPGIAMRIGTNVFIDGQWYSLSLPEDLDPVELASGTVGFVLEGKGEWGDTLRVLR